MPSGILFFLDFVVNLKVMDEGIRHRRPEAEHADEEAMPTPNQFDNNKYHNKKTKAKGLLNVALLSNNISTLRQLQKYHGTDQQHPFSEWIIGGLLLSICLQVSFRITHDLLRHDHYHDHLLTQ